MRITDLINKKSINLNLSSNNKMSVIDEMVDLVENSGNLNNKEEYKKAIIAREELSTTGIGEGIAIPHAKTSAVTKACLGAGGWTFNLASTKGKLITVLLVLMIVGSLVTPFFI